MAAVTGSFRPGPEHHILDTLSIRIPRCEDYTRVRKDRAPVLLGRGWLLSARRHRQGAPEVLWRGAARARARGRGASSGRAGGSVQSSADGSLTEAVFPVDCGVEAVPGLWTTGAAEGFVLLAAQELDYTLEPGDVVAEVRSGLVETAACDCGAFLSPGEDGPCETCGVAKAPELSEGCFSCGSGERTAMRSYQGCSSCSRTRGRRSACTRVGVFSVLAAVTALFGGGSYECPVEDPSVVTFLGGIPEENSWWDAPGGVASLGAAS